MSVNDEHKQTQMDSNLLFSRGMDFFSEGDYASARKDFMKILESSPKPTLEKKAREMIRKMGTDTVEIIAGVCVLLLVVFMFVYFGFR